MNLNKNSSGIAHNMKRICKKLGQVIFFYEKCDQQIAKYLKDKNLFAIITGNSEFMIFEGANQIWWSEQIEFSSKEVLCLRRNEIVRHLQLSQDQLCFIGILQAENDFLSSEILEKFHASLRRQKRNRKCLFTNLIDFVRENVMEPVNIDTMTAFVFGNNFCDYEKNAIENAFRHYIINMELKCDDESKLMHQTKQHYPEIYKLCRDGVYIVTDIAYIDFRHFKSMSYAELLIPILQRCLGILLYGQKSCPKIKTICMKRSHNEPFTNENEVIQYPSSKIVYLICFFLFCFND